MGLNLPSVWRAPHWIGARCDDWRRWRWGAAPMEAEAVEPPWSRDVWFPSHAHRPGERGVM